MNQPAHSISHPPRAAEPAPLSQCLAERRGYHWTTERALGFLKALARCGKVAQAARSVGMSRQSAYRLRARLEKTPQGAQFAQLWDRAVTGARAARQADKRHRSKVTLAPERDVFGIGR